MKLLENKNAIITGATRGIGKGIALEFAKQGCNIAFTYNSSVDAAKSLEKEKLEAELKFLKSQVHPHFLFNTLNNLYSLTLQKSDNAPEVVLKLTLRR